MIYEHTRKLRPKYFIHRTTQGPPGFNIPCWACPTLYFLQSAWRSKSKSCLCFALQCCSHAPGTQWKQMAFKKNCPWPPKFLPLPWAGAVQVQLSKSIPGAKPMSLTLLFIRKCCTWHPLGLQQLPTASYTWFSLLHLLQPPPFPPKGGGTPAIPIPARTCPVNFSSLNSQDYSHGKARKAFTCFKSMSAWSNWGFCKSIRQERKSANWPFRSRLLTSMVFSAALYTSITSGVDTSRVLSMILPSNSSKVHLFTEGSPWAPGCA